MKLSEFCRSVSSTLKSPSEIRYNEPVINMVHAVMGLMGELGAYDYARRAGGSYEDQLSAAGDIEFYIIMLDIELIHLNRKPLSHTPIITLTPKFLIVSEMAEHIKKAFVTNAPIKAPFLQNLSDRLHATLKREYAELGFTVEDARLHNHEKRKARFSVSYSG